MACTIQKVDVWSGSIVDKPGGLGERLIPLAEAGIDLEFVLARRESANRGVVFVAPIKGAAQARAAKVAGLSRASGIGALRIDGPNRQGLSARITTALSEADISIRGMSGFSVGRKCVIYIAFNGAKDTTEAKRILTKLLAS